MFKRSIYVERPFTRYERVYGWLLLVSYLKTCILSLLLATKIIGVPFLLINAISLTSR